MTDRSLPRKQRVLALIACTLTLATSHPTQASPEEQLDPAFGDHGLVTLIDGAWGNRLYTWAAARTLAPAHPDALVLLAVAVSGGAVDATYVSVASSGALIDAGSAGLGSCTPDACRSYQVATNDPTDPGHRLYAAGRESAGGSQRMLIARLAPLGDAIDPGWNGGAPVLLDVPGTTSSFARALAVQPDGKLLVAGNANGGGTSVLARFDDTGILDPSFGSGGTLVLPGQIVTSVALQDDGRIVLAGSFPDGVVTGFGIKRLAADGSVDSSFGASSGEPGVVSVYFAPRFTSGTAMGVDVLPDGRIVAAGSDWDHSAQKSSFVAARFLADGTLDSSFAKKGRLRKRVGKSCAAGDVAFQSDGRIVIAGSARHRHPEHHTEIALLRLTADGRPDRTYGRGGGVRTPIVPDDHGIAVEDASIDGQGRLTVVARIADGTGLGTVLARYLP